MEATNRTDSSQPRSLRQWVIVAVAAVGLFLGFGPIISFTFGVFLSPVAGEFGWGRGETSLAFSLSLLAMGIATPMLGKLVDRLGARTVILSAAIVFGGGLMSLSLLTPSLWHFYAVFLVMGLFGGGTAPVPYSKVISQWFDEKRGLALGLAMVGLGLGAFVMPSLANTLISNLGWRQAYVVIGGMVIFVTIPIVGLFLKENTQSPGPHTESESPSGAAVDGMSSGEARRTSEFWLMATSFFLVSSACHAGLIHMAPMLIDRGATAQTASLAISFLGGATLMGRVIAGLLLDRFFVSRVGIGFFAGVAAGLGLLWSGATGSVAFVAAVLVGLGLGAEVCTIAYVVGRYFGLRAFGEIHGYLFAAFILGAVVGPLLMGFSFDSLDGYEFALGILVVAVIVGVALLTRLGPYRTWEPAGEATASFDPIASASDPRQPTIE